VKRPDWILLAAQQPHAEHLGVEGQGAVQIAHPEHGVQQSHGDGRKGWQKGWQKGGEAAEPLRLPEPALA